MLTYDKKDGGGNLARVIVLATKIACHGLTTDTSISDYHLIKDLSINKRIAFPELTSADITRAKLMLGHYFDHSLQIDPACFHVQTK